MVTCSVENIPSTAKRWLQQVFKTTLDSRDQVRLQLSIWDSRADREQKLVKALQKNGLNTQQIQRIIRLIPN